MRNVIFILAGVFAAVALLVSVSIFVDEVRTMIWENEAIGITIIALATLIVSLFGFVVTIYQVKLEMFNNRLNYGEKLLEHTELYARIKGIKLLEDLYENATPENQIRIYKIFIDFMHISSVRRLDKVMSMFQSQEDLIDVKTALESFVKLPPPKKYKKLKTADFDSYRIQLPGMLLQNAQLQNAKLDDANLSGANLSGANLSGADLGGADLDDANLSGTILEGADHLDQETQFKNIIYEKGNPPRKLPKGISKPRDRAIIWIDKSKNLYEFVYDDEDEDDDE